METQKPVEQKVHICVEPRDGIKNEVHQPPRNLFLKILFMLGALLSAYALPVIFKSRNLSDIKEHCLIFGIGIALCSSYFLFRKLR